MHRARHSLLPALVFAAAAAAQSVPAPASPTRPSDDGFVQWAPPPGPATPGDTALIARAKVALESGRADVSTVLADPAYMPVHARTEFRNLIASSAKAAPVTICGLDEPGTRLTVTLEFLDEAARPVPDALVYLYHTSAKGWYSGQGAHVQADSGDFKHARLFGYARTDANGRVEVRTIRPAGYPHSDLPAHIHLGLTISGQPVGVGEVRFDDDPRMTPAQRKQSLAEGDRIVRVEKDPAGSERARAVFNVRPPHDPAKASRPADASRRP